MRLLFVGNSFTSRNNLPGLLATLAAARGVTVEHRLISAGGASLRQHLNAGKVLTELAGGNYDTVVLQEQSTLPAKNPARFHENVRDLHTAITESGAATALYLTWSRKNQPQEPLTTAYAAIAAELGVTLVPAGLIWQHFQTIHPTLPLHAPDNSHPALTGSYLAACVFLITLLHEDPTDLAVPIKGLDNDTADLLRRSAWEICESIAGTTS
ncbi:SGNH/GDSL hydrolase family protein [Kribbella sp. CA-293567]|uniref:SGNH/GDSL hydrolase family protein n=1 Tax=Kribbella sp. CA-293567 TaxID=3002436 RepID=UPI0022DE5699|nr:hypothetical protein [Kribbella sp. CA-293567]WBQ07182.1 hypothetical protein OX958_10355 [Kribbella sp. CA-293567]